MAGFVYKPLRDHEVRVLTLWPGQHDEPLVASLGHLTLGDDINYQAISYAWGKPVFSRSIHIDSEQLSITESLFGALRRFRHVDTSVCLWADQLCINQEDLAERNAQVSIMAEIFRNASEVLIWLGEAEGPHGAAFDLMRFLPEADLSSLYDGQSSPGRTWNHVRKEWQHRSPHLAFEASCIAFLTIARKAWFQRLWVVQEVMNSQHASLFCGQHCISYASALEAFGRFVELVKSRKSTGLNANIHVEEQITKIYETWIGWWQRGMFSATRFLRLLIQTSHLHASEPRDRVFALMSLAIKEERDGIIVDYAIELPELWRQIARLFLNTPTVHGGSSSQNSAILALRATQWDVVWSAVSSWSPDFGALNPVTQMKYLWYVREGRYSSAGGPNLGYPLPGPEGDVLKMPGVLLGEVHSIMRRSQAPSLSYSLPMGPAEPVRKLIRWHSSCLQFARENRFDFENGYFKDVLRQGITQYNPDRPQEDLLSVLETEVQRYPEYASNYDRVGGILDNLRVFVCPEDHVNHMDRTRLLATTNDRYFCWIPLQAQPGDRICLLQGYPAPFVVRRRPDGYYVIVGDAYVRGIMYGEAWPEDCNNITILQFK